jgi:hypothetical protein
MPLSATLSLPLLSGYITTVNTKLKASKFYNPFTNHGTGNVTLKKFAVNKTTTTMHIIHVDRF